MRPIGAHPVYWRSFEQEPPSNWVLRTFRDLASNFKGKLPKDLLTSPTPGAMPYLLVEGFEEGLWAYTCDNTLPQVTSSDSVVVADGSRSGWSLHGKTGALGSTLLCYRPKEGTDSDFLYYLLQSFYPFTNTATIGGAVPHLDTRLVDRLQLYVPNEKEDQAAIGAPLKTIDEALAAAELKLNAARRFKSALMQQLFTRGMPGRHTSFQQRKIGEVPERWEVLKLKKCGRWGSGGTPDRENKAFWNGSIPWVKSGEVDYRPISDTSEKITEAGAASINGELLSSGTLLVAMYGAGVTRGKAALLAISAYINQAIAFFQGDEKTNTEWLLYWFERNYERVRALAGGANQDNLSLYHLKNIEIERPEPSEQADIVELLKIASDAIIAAENECAAIEKLKRSLLQNLLTGRVRVRN